MRKAWRLWLGAMLVLAMVAGVTADTLYLRDGTRVDGELLTVRNGVIEFQPDRGRLIRVDQVDVRAIEFDGRNIGRGGGGANAFAPSGGRRPAGLRERRVTVQARGGWTDSGIDLRAGQTMYFEASGQVTWGRGRRDGPAGERNSPENDARPLPSRPAAALIGRIGETGVPFFIGDDGESFRARDGGRLFLGVNDDFLQDNSGNFRVTVYY